MRMWLIRSGTSSKSSSTPFHGDKKLFILAMCSGSIICSSAVSSQKLILRPVIWTMSLPSFIEMLGLLFISMRADRLIIRHWSWVKQKKTSDHLICHIWAIFSFGVWVLFLFHNTQFQSEIMKYILGEGLLET